jgi:hypothetical protein
LGSAEISAGKTAKPGSEWLLGVAEARGLAEGWGVFEAVVGTGLRAQAETEKLRQSRARADFDKRVRE